MYKRVNELLGTEYKSDSDIDWGWISSYQKLSESFIREFRYEVNLVLVSRYQVLSEDFIREFKDKVDWTFISVSQKLSESFIREFEDEVNWIWISRNQVLSESFIREFKDKVEWFWISLYQLLSWNFILEFEDRVNWNYISRSQPFIEDLSYEKIDKDYLRMNKLYHLYQQTKDRGWFLGYIKKENSKILSFFINYEESQLLTEKGIIYWKDLLTLNKIKSFESIRRIKYV